MGKITAVLLFALVATSVVLASPPQARNSKIAVDARRAALEAKLGTLGVKNPTDFLDDLIAQLTLTITGVAQAIVDTQKGLEAIVAPGGEELVNEVKFIIEIGGIRALEIAEPLLTMLQPLFPDPEVYAVLASGEKRSIQDLIGDLIRDLEEALGVPIHELYYTIETFFLNLDILRKQLITDIVAVAAKVGPEAVDQVEAHLIQSVIRIKDEIRPLWELISDIIPRSARFSFATSRILAN